MTKPIRRANEEGHRRKFLVVIDETEECERALYFAARRAQHTGGGLTLLYVIAPGDFQHWLNVESIMREEAMEEAQTALRRYGDLARSYADVDAELIVREGVKAEEIAKLIEEDQDIAILVLAAANSSEGPGPLVASLATGAAGNFAIPITIVPGMLSNDEIDGLA